MGQIEFASGREEPKDLFINITPWEALRADYSQHPDEYQTVLETVPPWGQDLLVRLYAHHQDSFAHSLRVAATIDLVLEGRSFGEMPPEKVTLAALLHDAGKEVIPLSILNKHGSLTREEKGVIKSHALQSYVAIQPHDLLVAQLAGGHHLYQRNPYGHEGAKHAPWDAAIGQQLIAVADVVDALGSERSYKPAWSQDVVRATLRRERNHSPFLIDKVIDAHFSMPPFDNALRNTTIVSPKNTLFTT